MGNTGEDADVLPVKMDKKKKKSKNRTNNLPDVGDGDVDGNDNTHVELDDAVPKEQAHTHKKKKKKKKKKKRKPKPKSKSNEDEVKDQNDVDLQKKHKNKRKRDSSENAQITENSYSQDDDQNPEKYKHDTNESNLENGSEKPKSKMKTKKATFSGHREIFPSSNTNTKNQKTEGDNLVRGKRFTPEEDKIVKQAVLNYITSHNLGDEGLKMVLNCRSHPGLKKCWQVIATCIPYRPHTAVYSRAHILFERGEKRSWTPEEISFLKESYKKHGNKWKMVANELGRHQVHVKQAWRNIMFENGNRGRWSLEEYQVLYDLVNLDLQMKIITDKEKKSKHGMLRDNISWTEISDKLSTRSNAKCCIKWYNHLTSSLVAEKKWLDADDYWLVGKLYEIDAACVEDVDWDGLLDHRGGEICRKRWDQMVVCIGDHRSKTFGEQVDILAKRYRPELAEARQIWDDKPVVP